MSLSLAIADGVWPVDHLCDHTQKEQKDKGANEVTYIEPEGVRLQIRQIRLR